MSAYLIAHIDVTNSQQYEQYKMLSTLAMRAHDVKPIVRGGEYEVLEGRDFKRTVIMQFPSVTAARSFYNSYQYKRARNARAGAAVVDMTIIEGA